jgi:hypothetical protein
MELPPDLELSRAFGTFTPPNVGLHHACVQVSKVDVANGVTVFNRLDIDDSGGATHGDSHPRKSLLGPESRNRRFLMNPCHDPLHLAHPVFMRSLLLTLAIVRLIPLPTIAR